MGTIFFFLSQNWKTATEEFLPRQGKSHETEQGSYRSVSHLSPDDFWSQIISLLWGGGGGCFIHSRSTPGLSLLDASDTVPQSWQPKTSPTFAKCPLGDKTALRWKWLLCVSPRAGRQDSLWATDIPAPATGIYLINKEKQKSVSFPSVTE